MSSAHTHAHTHTDGHTHTHSHTHAHPHSHAHLISDIRALRDDELGDRAQSRTIPDDEQTSAARAKAREDASFDNLIALGNALAFQMRYHEAIECYDKTVELRPDDYGARRKRAGRYLSILRLADADRELSWCVEHTNDVLDPKYMLGCCRYYAGDFDGAKALFDECVELSKNDGDMYVASLYWAVACSVRQGKSVASDMAKFNPDMEIGHHTGYMQSLKLFAGDAFCACDNIPIEDELQKHIFYYGAHLFYLAMRDAENADRFLDKTLSLDTYFSAFAYLGAYTEFLHRL